MTVESRTNQAREERHSRIQSDGIDMPGRYWGIAAVGNSTEASGWSKKE